LHLRDLIWSSGVGNCLPAEKWSLRFIGLYDFRGAYPGSSPDVPSSRTKNSGGLTCSTMRGLPKTIG
jgi:hypothetical protein